MDTELELLRLLNLSYTKGCTKTSLRAAITALLSRVRTETCKGLFDGER